MRTSPSLRPGAKPPAPAPVRALWPYMLLICVLAASAVAVIALPASMLARFLPPAVHAEDFSGSVWHGSAGRIAVNSRDAGALEWRLHPAPLLRLRVVADLHWVKGGFVLDGAVELDRHGIGASDVKGGGPIADLRDLGLGQGWQGSAGIRVKEFKAVFSGAGASVRSAVGEVSVADLASPQVAAGANLGGYSLHFTDPAMTPDTDATGTLADTGGPLSVNAVIHYSARERRGILSGTVRERADAPAALRSELDNLAQLHARDAQGRLPVDLEFTL